VRNSLAVAATVAATALAAPAGASAATLAVEPVEACYREQQSVVLTGSGFGASSLVDISRDGSSLGTLAADASGAFQGTLELPGLASGQRSLTYVATDTANSALTAPVTVVATATDVDVRPLAGPANRRLRIRARGFFGGRTLWAHLIRRGRGAVRTVKIGRVKGPCRKVRARKRLLRANTPAGEYRVQFDTFRRYKAKRKVEYDRLSVTVTGG